MQRMPASDVLQRLAIDITGPHPTSRNGFKYMLTGVDLFTRWAFAIPIVTHDAKTVARCLVDRVFPLVGIPEEILSDRGREFLSKLMSDLCDMLQVRRLTTSAYKPSTNGCVERFHRTLNMLLAKVMNDRQDDWDEWVTFTLSAYNASTQLNTRALGIVRIN